MIFLIILGVILLLLALVLFLPVNVWVEFKEDFFVKIRFCSIKVYELKPAKKQDTGTEKTEITEIKEKPKGIFSKFKEKFGFSGAVREFFVFFKDVFSHTKGFLRHIKIEKTNLFIKIASPDAAKTAIDYGIVCAAVYPVLAMLDSVGNIKYKKIDIKSDFESATSDFSFGFDIKLKIFFLLITLFKVYKDYKKFTARIETNERK